MAKYLGTEIGFSTHVTEVATDAHLGKAFKWIGSANWGTSRTGTARFHDVSDAISALIALHEGRPVDGVLR